MLNSMEVFNVAADSWTTSSTTLPAPTCGLAAAVDLNGMIYVIGGDYPVNNVATPSANVYIYDPAAPGWTSQPSLSTARLALAASTGPDGLIYAIGGSDGTNALTTVEAYADYRRGLCARQVLPHRAPDRASRKAIDRCGERLSRNPSAGSGGRSTGACSPESTDCSPGGATKGVPPQ